MARSEELHCIARIGDRCNAMREPDCKDRRVHCSTLQCIAVHCNDVGAASRVRVVWRGQPQAQYPLTTHKVPSQLFHGYFDRAVAVADELNSSAEGNGDGGDGSLVSAEAVAALVYNICNMGKDDVAIVFSRILFPLELATLSSPKSSSGPRSGAISAWSTTSRPTRCSSASV